MLILGNSVSWAKLLNHILVELQQQERKNITMAIFRLFVLVKSVVIKQNFLYLMKD